MVAPFNSSWEPDHLFTGESIDLRGYKVHHPQLLRGKEATIRDTRPSILDVDDAADFGLERFSNLVQEIL